MSYPLAIDNGCLSMKIHLNDEKKTRIKKQEISIIFLSSIKMIHSSSSQSSISFSLMHKQPVTQFFIKVCSRSAQRDDVDIVHCEKGNEKKTICSSESWVTTHTSSPPQWWKDSHTKIKFMLRRLRRSNTTLLIHDSASRTSFLYLFNFSMWFLENRRAYCLLISGQRRWRVNIRNEEEKNMCR